MTTAEERMLDVLNVAVKEWDKKSLTDDATEREESKRLLHIIRKHGAAAIRAAVAEERARIVSWLPTLVAKGATSMQVLYEIRHGEPEAWAERTGWKAP